MIPKLNNIISGIFALLWSLVVLIQYWNYNPNYEKAFEFFQYGHLLIFLLALGAGLSFVLAKFPKKLNKRINGLVIFAGLCLIDFVNFKFYYATDQSVKGETASFISHFGWFLGFIVMLFFFYLIMRVLGTIFSTIFSRI